MSKMNYGERPSFMRRRMRKGEEMGEKLAEFLMVQKELNQILLLIAAQLAVSSQVVSIQIPKATELFQRLNELALEIGIPIEHPGETDGK